MMSMHDGQAAHLVQDEGGEDHAEDAWRRGGDEPGQPRRADHDARLSGEIDAQQVLRCGRQEQVGRKV